MDISRYDTPQDAITVLQGRIIELEMAAGIPPPAFPTAFSKMFFWAGTKRWPPLKYPAATRAARKSDTPEASRELKELALKRDEARERGKQARAAAVLRAAGLIRLRQEASLVVAPASDKPPAKRPRRR